MDKYGFSEIECKIILDQIQRRAYWRQEFLRLRTDPCLNSKEAGYVFDPAVQRFLAMKVTQLDHFPFNTRTISMAIFTIIIPFSAYGYLIWTNRQKIEKDIRCGKLKYKDRLFKFQ